MFFNVVFAHLMYYIINVLGKHRNITTNWSTHLNSSPYILIENYSFLIKTINIKKYTSHTKILLTPHFKSQNKCKIYFFV